MSQVPGKVEMLVGLLFVGLSDAPLYMLVTGGHLKKPRENFPLTLHQEWIEVRTWKEVIESWNTGTWRIIWSNPSWEKDGHHFSSNLSAPICRDVVSYWKDWGKSVERWKHRDPHLQYPSPTLQEGLAAFTSFLLLSCAAKKGWDEDGEDSTQLGKIPHNTNPEKN